METLNKITKESFYCYRGFIIRLYKSGTFALYDTHTMGSLSANTEQDRLSACMEKIDKI